MMWVLCYAVIAVLASAVAVPLRERAQLRLWPNQSIDQVMLWLEVTAIGVFWPLVLLFILFYSAVKGVRRYLDTREVKP